MLNVNRLGLGRGLGLRGLGNLSNLGDLSSPLGNLGGLGSLGLDDREEFRSLRKLRSKREIESELQPLIAMKSVISLLSLHQMRAMSAVTIESDQPYGQATINDDRMGPSVSSDRSNVGNVRCAYCGLIGCTSHPGFFPLRRPILNPAVARDCVRVLTIVCNSCAQPRIAPEVMRERGYDKLSPYNKLKALEDFCKTLVGLRCVHPRSDGNTCDINPVYIAADCKTKGGIYRKIPTKGKRDLSGEVIQEVPISEVLNILTRISDKTSFQIGFSKGSHPRDMILNGLLVPPPIARPMSMEGDHGRPHYITHGLLQVIRKDNSNASQADVYQELFKLIYNSSAAASTMTHGDVKTIISDLQGKKSLIRYLVMGKRQNNSGRTVASSDSTLAFGEIGVPRVWAPKLTKRVKITNFNTEYLYSLVDIGQVTHYISNKTGARKKMSTNQQLQVGDYVDRWLQDGDIVCLNRQPTLHRQSFMGFRVRLGDHYTLNLHLSYTPPLNCDFDGDENNLWNIQDEETESEVVHIMDVKKNIMSTEHNRQMVGLVLNSIEAGYLLTDSNVIIDDYLFRDLLDIISNKTDFPTFYTRLVAYGVNPRSGRALLSALFPADFFYSHDDFHICEGIILNEIERPETGISRSRITKGIIGIGHRSIGQELWKKYGEDRTSDFLTDAPRIMNKWLNQRGSSVSMADCITIGRDENGQLYDVNMRLTKPIIAQVQLTLRSLGPKRDDPIEEQFRRRRIIEAVNKADGAGKLIAKKAMDDSNAFKIMTDQGSGAKGGTANIGQMFASVCQQFSFGYRLEPKLGGDERLNIKYDKYDLSAEANGFIIPSFMMGLSPTDLHQLHMGSREGLLQVSTSTSVTGTISKKISKALENTLIWLDNTVRNTQGALFALIFNCGYDTSATINVKREGRKYSVSYIDIVRVAEDLNGKRGWIKKNIADVITTGQSNLRPQDDPILGAYPTEFKPIEDGRSRFNFRDIKNVNDGLQKYHKARIIATRSKQLANNFPPLVDYQALGLVTSRTIAEEEFRQGVINLEIVKMASDSSIIRVPSTQV